jgi:SNF2 family DNA or RNA helicase
MKCNLISLHHYKRTVQAFEQCGIKVLVYKSIPYRYAKLIKQVKFKDTESIRHNPKLWTEDKNIKLYDYQKDCVSITFNRRKYIMADDMGIGKTAQSTAVMLHGFENGYKRALLSTSGEMNCSSLAD